MDSRDWQWVNGDLGEGGSERRFRSRTICAISREYSGFLFCGFAQPLQVSFPSVPPDSS